jgi:hypothetical protein
MSLEKPFYRKGRKGREGIQGLKQLDRPAQFGEAFQMQVQGFALPCEPLRPLR